MLCSDAMIHLEPLMILTGTATIEQLGKVQEGERIKVETRTAGAAGSPITGKARGTDWILFRPDAIAETNSVHEIKIESGHPLVLELRGYAETQNGGGMQIRACGVIRASAAELSHLNGRVALMEEKIGQDRRVEMAAYWL